MRTILTPIFLATLLSACALYKVTYIEPSKDTPSADLTIITTAPHFNIGVVSYPPGVEAESKGDSVGIFNSKIPGIAAQNSLKIKIASGKPFVFSLKISDLFMVGNMAHGTLCTTKVTFIPETNKSYRATHAALPNGGCDLEIVAVGTDGKPEVVTTAKKLDSCIDPQIDGKAFVLQNPGRVCKK